MRYWNGHQWKESSGFDATKTLDKEPSKCVVEFVPAAGNEPRSDATAFTECRCFETECTCFGPVALAVDTSRLEDATLETRVGNGTTENASSMFHIGCGGEVLVIDDGAICDKCGAQQDTQLVASHELSDVELEKLTAPHGE